MFNLKRIGSAFILEAWQEGMCSYMEKNIIYFIVYINSFVEFYFIFTSQITYLKCTI